MQLVPFAADWKFSPLDFEAGFCRGSLHHLDGFRHDLEPDIVSQQDSDLKHRYLRLTGQRTRRLYSVEPMRLVRAQACRFYHFGPACDFGFDERSELRGR